MRRIASALMFAALLTGCGRPVGVVPVSGRVLYHGEPLTGGTVVFTPDTERGGSGPLACAVIAADGRYTLRIDGETEAPVGCYVVTVAPPSGGPFLPPRYRDPERSGQRVEVRPDHGPYDLHLE